MTYFNLHTHRFSNTQNHLELVNQYPWEFNSAIPQYSIGIHPWYAQLSRLENDLAFMNKQLQQKQCWAVGECGLDKRIALDIEEQKEIFKAQILLAEKHQKPIVLHCVAAFQEIIAIKKELAVSVPMIIHGFSKNLSIAQQLLKNGFYLSFGKYLLRNPELRTVFEAVPMDCFFLETDTIDESIEEVYALAAHYKKITLQELQLQIENNFKMVFQNTTLL